MRKLFFLALLVSCKKEPGHVCKWDHCPYKGITYRVYPAHAEYEQGTDAYCIDALHILYPNDDYEILEQRLIESR